MTSLPSSLPFLLDVTSLESPLRQGPVLFHTVPQIVAQSLARGQAEGSRGDYRTSGAGGAGGSTTTAASSHWRESAAPGAGSFSPALSVLQPLPQLSPWSHPHQGQRLPTPLVLHMSLILQFLCCLGPTLGPEVARSLMRSSGVGPLAVVPPLLSPCCLPARAQG